MHRRLIRRITSVLLALLIVCGPGRTGAWAEHGVDLSVLVKSSLTEMFGYTAEEAEGFVTQTQADGSVRFWPEGRPDLVYTLYVDESRQVAAVSPYETGYIRSASESALRRFLRAIREESLFGPWNEEHRQALIAMLREVYHQPTNEVYFALDAGGALHGLLETVFGPDMGWTDAVRSLFQAQLEAHHLTWTPEPFHAPGVRRITYPARDTVAVTTLTLFEGELPEEFRDLFSDPRLTGWTCHSGAVVTHDWSAAQGLITLPEGLGLAALEKEGKRALFQLNKENGAWRITPLGENALPKAGDYRVTWRCGRETFAVDRPLEGGGTESLYVSPQAGDFGYFCKIQGMEHLDPASGEKWWLNGASYQSASWKDETRADLSEAGVPLTLGQVPFGDLLSSPEEIRRKSSSALPEGWTVVSGVQLREKTSSQSRSFGTLQPGAVLPVLELLPGSGNSWVKTRLGFLSGYFSALYAQVENSHIFLDTPQPLAEAKKEITLQKGTGWLKLGWPAEAAGTFPKGTRMHVFLEDGDWLYVSVPREGFRWLPDLDGTFGYVRKGEVVMGYTESALDWLAE